MFCFLFCFICHFYPPFTRKRIVSLYFGREVRTRLGVAFFEVYGPPVFHIKLGRPVKCLAQGHNKHDKWILLLSNLCDMMTVLNTLYESMQGECRTMIGSQTNYDFQKKSESWYVEVKNKKFASFAAFPILN